MITKLNPHGLMARLYRNFYNSCDLPNNLCPYFWKLVFAILMFPFVLPAIIINSIWNPFSYDKEYFASHQRYRGGWGRIQTAFGLLIHLALFLAGGLTNLVLYGKSTSQHMSLEKFYINGVIAVVLFVCAVNLLAFLIRLIPKKEKKVLTDEEQDAAWRKRREKDIEREEKWRRSFVYLCWQAFIAWKDRVCPQIEWKSDK